MVCEKEMRRRIVKKVFLLVLCLCVFMCIAASAEETGPNTILLKVTNLSDLDISYMRFDLYRGDKYIGLVASCPDEGEDFYRCPIELEAPEEAADLQIRYSYGISDLPPEEAVLQVMMNNPAEEHPLDAPELTLECGKTYSIALITDPGAEGYKLLLRGNSWSDWSMPEELKETSSKDALLESLTDFYNNWSREDYDAMLELCTADWKAEVQDPAEELLAILDNRQPKQITPEEFSGTDEDTVRTVTLRVYASKGSATPGEEYYYHVVMEKEEDGIWRVDPRSLQDCEPVPEER